MMRNRSMAAKLARGEAIDVAPYRTETEGLYRLPANLSVESVDLCDAEHGAWIWSVGRRLAAPHEVVAATDARFYQNPEWECLWLR